MSNPLLTGRPLPVIGFGTWQITPEPTAHRVVAQALQAGYRLIDTARIYGNEAGVGQAIRESSIPRSEIILTTKLWNDDQGYDRTMQAFEGSLERLGLEYVDIYLIHWPATSRRHDSWQAMEELLNTGRIKAAGVSNYTIRHLHDLAEHSKVKPIINQVEFHPFIYKQQAELLDYCQQHGIIVEAYSPLNRISSERHASIQQLADRYERTPQQIILRWCVQHGTIPLVRSFDRAHMASNLAITDFTLQDSDMEILDNLSDGRRVTWDPAGMG
jgi:diketogulonate reductase-like aldo/keto reductase